MILDHDRYFPGTGVGIAFFHRLIPTKFTKHEECIKKPYYAIITLLRAAVPFQKSFVLDFR